MAEGGRMKAELANYDVTIARYDDAREVCEFAAQRRRTNREESREGKENAEFADGTFQDSVIDVHGHPRCMDQVTKMFDTLDGISPRGNTPRFSPAVAGAYPVIGDFLAGMPECMRAKTMVREDTAPIRVFVGLGMNAGVSSKSMQVRGSALAALIARLSESRAVEAYAYVDDGTQHGAIKNVVHIIPLPTRPLDLSNIAAVVASPTFRRQIMFYAAEAIFSDGNNGMICPLWVGSGAISIGPDYAPDRSSPAYCARVRELLGAAPGDFVMRSGDYKTVADIERDPIKWTRATLAELMATDAENLDD